MTHSEGWLAFAVLVLAIIVIALDARSEEVELRFEHPPEAESIEPTPYPTLDLRICVESEFCTEREVPCALGETCSVTINAPNDAQVTVAVGRDGLWSGPSNAKRVYDPAGAMDADGDGAISTLDFAVFFEHFTASQ